MKLFIGTKQQVAPGTCVGAKKFFGILLLQLLFTCASTSLQAQPEWQINGNNPSGGQPILGTLNSEPLRFYAGGSQRGIFSPYNGFLGVGINAPKNPLHIHSSDAREHYYDFVYENPEPPIVGNYDDRNRDSTCSRSVSLSSSHYSGLQITNGITGTNSNDGLLMYVHGHQGFLRHLEDELFTIGMSNLDIMNFTPAGNVGIGTYQPAQMLHVVNGNVLISRTPSISNRAPGSRNGSLLFGDVIDANTQYGNWGIEYMNDPNHPEYGQGLNFWQPSGANQLTANYRLFLADNGNIGIGTGHPAQMLHVVDGNILISRTSNMGNRAPSSRNGSLLFGDDIDGNTQYGSWGIEYVNDPNHPEQGQGLNFWQPFGANHLSTTNYRLFLADDGKVGIGTQFPHAELSVNGTVLAKAVRVTTNATYWPDYVFGSDYKLMTLSELESYVNENRHLPGIPSASEVEEEGSVDLGEMNALLLQKVEELTRYIINLQKQIDELKEGKE